MIDFHSHILPGMDDGSKDLAESLALVQMLAEQGVETVVATPHFYANHESVDQFLARRQAAYELLPRHLPEGAPRILLGAEVRYYEGISRLSDLKSLRIQGSKLLLLEMSMSRWTEYTVRELEDLSRFRDVTLVMAHIERYLGVQDPAVLDRLLSDGILMQVNAGFFNRFLTRRKALRMLADGTVHLVGSDCHNLTDRPPMLHKAYQTIAKKLGDGFVTQMNDYAGDLLARSGETHRYSL